MLDDSLEPVSIDAVDVGDYVVVGLPLAGGPRCVVAKRAKSNARTERVVGWLVELSGGELTWLRNGATVWRRRAT
jgi:hypothetical protein